MKEISFPRRGKVIMVFNATFNNISVILWLSVLLFEETEEYPEKTTDLSQVTDKFYDGPLFPKISCIF